jgi:2-C-methyl-D-erythritol 4-phosphate cytidylyltransferase
MRVTAIVLAAGKGERFKPKVSKPLFEINKQPILIYSLKVFSGHPWVKDIIVVVNSLNRGKIIAEIKEYRIKKIRAVVLGGRRRQDSVIRGLKVIDNHTDFILIHDAARPFINSDIVSAAINKAKKYGAAVVGIPVKATVKECRKFAVRKTIDRKNLWEIQTPQVFKKDLILKAYKKFGTIDVTDDASVVERLGHKVVVVMGSQNNIKITTSEDLIVAEAIARKSYQRLLISIKQKHGY